MAKALPWTADPPDDLHANAAALLLDAWSADREFTRAIARIEWVADGVQSDELPVLQYARRIAGIFPNRLPYSLYLPFPTHTFTQVDARKSLVTFLFALDSAADDAPHLTDALEELPEPVEYLMSNPRAAAHLAWIEYRDAEIALLVAEKSRALQGDLLAYAMQSMGGIAVDSQVGLKNLKKLVAQPWFADGLSDEDAVLITILSDYSQDAAGYNSRLQSRYIQTDAVATPLRGDIRIRVVRNRPIHRDWVTPIKQSVQVLEEFLGTPFVTDEVILEVTGAETGAFHQEAHMGVPAEIFAAIFHETAHYYFTYGPAWLNEGGASFADGYMLATEGTQGRIRHIADVNRASSLCRDDIGIENLMHYNQHEFDFPRGCVYSLGENLLLAILNVVGEDALGAALGEILISARAAAATDDSITERVIYDIFLKHTPSNSRDEFRAVYDRLHGGPALPSIPDDHPDDIHSIVITGDAHPIAIGEAVVGELDYRHDIDIFKFEAEEGKTYRVSVEHDALRESDIWVYEGRFGNGPGRAGPTNGKWRTERSSSGPQALWVAPASGRHYAAVENFGGHSGSYTLTITEEQYPMDYSSSSSR